LESLKENYIDRKIIIVASYPEIFLNLSSEIMHPGSIKRISFLQYSVILYSRIR
jgi:hypothetical protein